jgi:hypothetical protein
MTNAIDPKLLTFAKTKSSALVSSPADMIQFGSLQYIINNEYTDKYSKFGHVKYISIDEEENSKKNWLKDFSYFINDMGFRGEYPNAAEKNVFAFFGCSITFGQGLPTEDIYPHLVSKHFNKQYLNLGIPGSNIHRTALIFSAATKIWDIETAVINLPPYTRCHYADSDNHLHSILLGHETELPNLEIVRNDILKDFSNQFLLSQSIDAIHWMIDIAKSKKIKLVLSSWEVETADLVDTAFNTNILRFNIVDYGRDNHPGELSHQRFANTVINTLTNETCIC